MAIFILRFRHSSKILFLAVVAFTIATYLSFLFTGHNSKGIVLDIVKMKT